MLRLAHGGRAVLRVTWRWTRRLLILVATVVGLILTTLAVVQWTPAGRDAVLRVGLTQVNALVPGTIQAQRLGRLSLLGIELSGVRVLDPEGTQVLSLDEVAIQTQLSSLLRGNIALRLVRVRGLQMDARVLEERRGLLAAFVDPDAPASPPSSGPPPDIWVEEVDLRDLHVRVAPLDPIGQLDAHLSEFTGAFRLIQGIPSARIDRAKLALTREGETILDLRALGKIRDEDEPSHVELHLDSLGMSLDLSADAFLPHQEAWQEQELSVQAGVQGVTGERLARLLKDPSLEQAFLGAVGMSIQVDGTINTPQAKGAITTAAGIVEIAELSAKATEWKVALSTRDFRLNELRADLPPRRVTAEVSLSAEGTIPEPLSFKVRLRSAQLDSIELMDLDLQGRLRDKRIEDLQLSLEQGDSKMGAQGAVSFAGEANIKVQIDLRPTLVQRLAQVAEVPVQGRLRGYAQIQRKPDGELTLGGRLNIDEARGDEWKVRAVETRFSLNGKPEELAGSVHLQVNDAAAGDAYLDELNLHAQGSARELGVKLSALAASTPRPLDGQRSPDKQAEVELAIKLQRRGVSTGVEGSGSGQLLGRPWEVEIQKTEVFDKGAVTSEGVTLSVGGQRLVLSGSFGGAGAPGSSTELRLRGQSLDVARLAELAGLGEPLVGKLDLNAVLRGTPTVPEVQLEARGDGLGLKGKPLVDFKLEAQLDAKEGLAQLDSTVSSGQDLKVLFEGAARFDGGAGALQRLVDADVQVALKVDKLTTKVLEPYLPPDSIPTAAELEGEIRASGSRADPRLETSLSIATAEAGGSARLQHRLKYAEGSMETDMQVRDALGLWAQAQGQVQLSPQTLTLEQVLQKIPQAAENAELRLELTTRKRELSKLPLIRLFIDPAELPPLAVSSELALTKKSGSEPEVRIRLLANQSQDLALGGCQSARGAVEIEATHQGKDNQITLRALIKKREALRLHLAMEQPVVPLFAGAKPFPGPLSLELSSAELELEELPFVCERATGRVSFVGQGSDLIGKKPRLDLRAEVERLSLGGRDKVDGKISVRADHRGIEAAAEVRARERFAGQGASFQAKIPWRLAEGKLELEDDLPLDAQLQLHHLPIGPLLPPKGAISYARGSLDGEVRAKGTLSSPDLSGEIRLEDLAFTSTAIAQPLRDIRGRLVFSGRKVKIQKLQAHDRDGTLSIDGLIDLTDTERVSGEVHLVAEDFPIRQAGQVVAITNLKAHATSTVTPEGTEAHLQLSEVDTWLENSEIRSGISLEGHADFNLDGRMTPAKSKSESAPERSEDTGAESSIEPAAQERRTHIVLESADRFWIKREDFAVKLDLLLETELVGDDVRVTGVVGIDRGYLLLFGKPFDLKRESELRFIGSSPPDPVLAIEASHQTREGKVVGVRITGRGSAPVVTFIVDEVPVDASIAVQALFGSKKSNDDDDDPSLQAQSFVSALSAGVLATAARRELGAAAPILMIDPDDTAGQGRVRAGFELDEIVPEFLQPLITGVYLEGIVAREAQGEAAAQTNFGALLELYHPKNLFTAGQYGPGTTWSVDFGWQPF